MPWIIGLLQTIYVRKLSGRFTNEAICSLFQKIHSKANNLIEDSQFSRIIYLFLTIGLQSYNLRLMMKLHQFYPNIVSKYACIKMRLREPNVEFLSKVASELYFEDHQLLLTIVTDVEISENIRFIFLRICAKLDLKGEFLSEIFSLLPSEGQIYLSGFLLDTEPSSEPERNAIWIRNSDLFEKFVDGEIDDKHRKLFVTLNHWKFGPGPFDYSRLDTLLTLSPFSYYQLPFLKAAVKTGQFYILHHKYFIIPTTDLYCSVNCSFETDPDYWQLMTFNYAFHSFVEKYFLRYYSCNFKYEMPCIRHRLTKFKLKNVKLLLNSAQLDIVHLGLIVIGESPSALEVFFNRRRIWIDEIFEILRLLFIIRGEEDKIVDWIAVVLKALDKRSFFCFYIYLNFNDLKLPRFLE